MLSDRLTIITVYTPAHKGVLYRNYELTEKLNTKERPRWVAVGYDNLHISKKGYRRAVKRMGASPKDMDRDKFAASFSEDLDMELACPEMELIPGPSREEIVARVKADLPVELPENDFKFHLDKFFASYSHAMGLQRALAEVKTRYLLILDPDFYLVKPEWVTEILEYMGRKELAFFGVPWHPRWFLKYRDFPCVHCFFVDLEKVKFSADYLHPELLSGAVKASGFWLDFVSKQSPKPRRERLGFLLKNIKQAIREDMQQRRNIGASRDTGYRLYEEYAKSGKYKFEVAFPVFDNVGAAFRPASVIRAQYARTLERFLPEKLRYVPPRHTYTRFGFHRYGLPDVRGAGWEEFLWRGMPLGFHMRGELHRERFDTMTPKQLDKVLRRVLWRNGREIPPSFQRAEELDDAEELSDDAPSL